ncbi:MAG: MtrB/PioB family decaheme-associated outer membrane protein [Halopseudomonas sp.]
MKIKQCVVAMSSEPKGWIKLPSMLVATLLVSAPMTSWAAVYDDDEEEGEDYSEVALVTQRTNELTSSVDIGLRYITDDAFKFGEYNSQHQKGWQLDGGFDIEQRDFEDGTAKYFRAEGNSLGTKSRDFSLEGGQQGDHKFRIFFDGIEKQLHGQFISNLGPVGGDPYNQTTAAATGTSEAVSVLREKVGVEFAKQTKSNWRFSAGATQENKTGTRDYGTLSFDKPTLYLYPIDYTTSNVNLGAEYGSNDYRLQLGYEFSAFDNAGDQVTHDTASAETAQEPDNKFQQLHANVTYRVTQATRLNAFLAYNQGEQNEEIIGSGGVNADAKVENIIARLGVSSRLTNKLTLNAKYNYQDKDNSTAEYVNGSTRTTPAFDTTWQSVELDGYYRLPSASKIGLGYEHEKIERPDQNREKTNEDKLWASYKLPMMGKLSGTIKLSIADRDGSAYDPDHISVEIVGGTGRISSPGAQKYHTADREQIKGQVNLQYQLGRTGHIGLMLQQWNDDYNETAYGLQELDGSMYSVDFGASPMRTLSYSLYAGVQQFEYDQTGVPGAGAVPSDAWSVDTDNSSFLAGLDLNWEAVPNLVAVKFGYRFTETEDSYSQVNAGTAVTGACASPPTGACALPDTETQIHTVELSGEYFFDKQTTFLARVVYEDYENNNWAYELADGGFATSNTASIENPNHSAGLVEFGVRYQF